jgi:restriction endonuclease S subunit
MTDFNNKTIEELIEFCKSKNINFLTKAKKPMSKKTIISNLKKEGLIEESDDCEIKEETEDIDLIIKICHNFLYKSAGIVGSKAQNDIMKILILRIFNILIFKKNEYILKVISDENLDKNVCLDEDEKNKYKSYLNDINNFIKYGDDIRNVWYNFIPQFMHVLFPNIYSSDDSNFNTPNEHDVKKLILIISKLKITDEFINDFVMKNGNIHESFLKYQGNVNSKELGQFFTPKNIIKSLLNECGFKELILNKEGSNFSLYDPCMGTGGLLCYTYNYCKDKIDASKITGCEIEKDTIKFGSVSLMLTTNQYNSNIVRCNALVENPYLFTDEKFHIIIVNPPFGTKNNYKQLKKIFDDYKGNSDIQFKDVYPIESNVGTALFIQMVIYSLKVEGLACIILPDGEMMTSNGSYNIRKFILDNCQVLKIINIQGGTFTNTGIKTKALFLKKGDYDNYNQEVEFIEINEEVQELGKFKLNEKLQFNLNNKKEEEIINYNTDIEIKKLGEVCEFLPKSKRQASFGKDDGIYNFYTSSEKIKKCDINDYNEECLIIGTGGNANIKLSSNFSCSADNYILKSNYNKYIYYYLKLNINILEDKFTGFTIKHISKKDIEDLKIPIPSIKIQNKIVEYLDMIYEEVIKTNNEKIENIKKLNKSYLDLNLQFNKDISIKTLGEVCQVNQGTYITKDIKINGEYPVYGGGNISYYINQYNREDEIIISKDGVSIDCVRYEKNKFFLNHHGWTLKCNELVIKKYLYYYLYSIRDKLLNIATGIAQLGINQKNFYDINIHIPSIEKQKEIVEYLDFNNDLIKSLEKQTELTKTNATEFMKLALLK